MPLLYNDNTYTCIVCIPNFTSCITPYGYHTNDIGEWMSVAL